MTTNNMPQSTRSGRLSIVIDPYDGTMLWIKQTC
jgi:hypothetical protein